LFNAAAVLCGLEGVSAEEAIHLLINLIAAGEKAVAPEVVFRLVHERDRCGITLLHAETAVVHARVEGLQQLRLAMATSREGFACTAGQSGFECTGPEPASVKLLVLMLAPIDDPAGHLRALAALVAICQSQGFVERLSSLQDPVLVWESFEKAGQRLPEYVAARDLMRPDFPRLRDTATLRHAIDVLCREGVSELPVVDADGDLVGVVSEDELIRVCLPEYITWMDDLSPILNFEPFAEVLRREAHVPVLEIMMFAERYATVDEETPAIQVAKVMMRRDVRQVLVVRDKRLVGIVSIQDFIHKVLRA